MCTGTLAVELVVTSHNWDRRLTLECISPCLIKEVFLVTIVGDVSDALLVDLTPRKHLESIVFYPQGSIAFSFVWRVVDDSHSLGAFREDWGILRYLLSSGHNVLGCRPWYTCGVWCPGVMLAVTIAAEGVE
jgi:hypothetical protein